MAEGQVHLNDQSYIPIVDMQDDIQANANDIKIINAQESLNLSNELSIIEDMVSNTETVQEIKSNETPEKNTGTPSEDRTTESPSTGENYIYKCVFCDQLLTAADEPKLLECLHNACGSCTNNKLYEQNENQHKGVECPTCGLTCEANKIIDNQFLLESNTNEESTSKTTDLKCSSCSDDIVATSWCVDCSEYICDICVQAHQRLKITKDHTIKPKEEGAPENQTTSSSMSSTLFCTTHPHEKLSLFCEHCDKLTCRDCQLLEHRDHKYKFTHEIAHDARKFIAAMLKDISYKRILLNSAMKVIADRQSLITDKKKALVNEITQLVVKLTNTINVRGKQLVTKLTEVCDSKQKTLQEKKIALDQLSKMTDHCIQFTQHALDNGSDMALLYSKKQVTSHLQRIKCKRADIPNPEIPVRIHLALDKVPELIKGLSSVISTIGQIVVDGRVYPSQPSSPSTSMTPQSSPSPVHQQAPMNALHQQLQHTPQHLLQSPHMQQVQQQAQSPHLSHPSQHQQQQQQQQQHQQQQHQQLQQQQQQPSPQQSLLASFQSQQQQHHSQQSSAQQNHPPQSHPPQSHPPQSHPQPTHNQQSHPQQRMLPPYGQQYNQNLGLPLNQNTQQSLGQRLPQNLGNMPPSHPANIPISLPQHLQQGHIAQRIPMQRSPIRPMLPICHKPGGLNSQQQVTSSTHPQGIMQDRSNLRGLLQANGNAVYVQTAPGQYQAVQPQYAQQFQNRFQGPQQYRQQMRIMHPNQQTSTQQHLSNAVRIPIQRQGFQSPPLQQQQPQSQQNQQNQPTQPSLKWHIPQQADGSVPITRPNSNVSQAQPYINDNFKITLKSQNHDAKSFSSVSSTIPKTPSPNHIQSKTDTENNLDKYCEESVNDLMATIAKLDSNGVQVLAESRPKTGGSPHVDSSTGDLTGPTLKLKSESMEMGKDDPNEDWCAVCMDGGELVCCDKCPKVFHQSCHIPNLKIEENDTWQCLLCMNFADIPENALGEKKEGQLSIKERKIAERLVLELYCQYEPSLPFRELISPDNIEYHTIIKKAMALDSIRQKLDWNSSECYTHLEQLVRDVRLMFQNAYRYNALGNPIYNDAKALEKFFDEQLEKWLPEYAYETFDDDDMHPPNKKYRRIISD